ncbi:alpha-amylase family glycosyl hydrolase [Geomonas sp.]|uniref:alpha-amylase family glycosyl hydrolase n=1 Tax=Geomonas sp. TaxID=2651584 RepID=UPI002B468454|nr:alpha-amylase family glycosyl hydrolase [Geomonas sp.]HJV34648.1 alpha-amylase family glycosyl hydrolase [Geomonas sp.]
MFYMSNRLGAWQVGDDADRGNVEFKIFFPKLDSGHDPQIASIKVFGDFQSQISPHADWDFDNGFDLKPVSVPEGTIWSYRTENELQSGYYQYKYLVTFNDHTQRKVSDPCTRYGGTENENAAFVIGGSKAADNLIAPLKSGRKHLRDLIVYELMIDDFTNGYIEAEAPLAAVIEKLDYIKGLGFNAILFMPWTAWKNRQFDWGYEPFQYFAVEYRYANAWGQPAEKISWLKKLVNECHLRDIHVIMDGVFNHVSMDFPYKAMYLIPDDCPYAGDFGGTFTGLQDLNFHNACTNEFILDVCCYWIDTFKIDGIRFDNTVNYIDYAVAGDQRGLPELLDGIKKHMDDLGESNFSLTLEHISKDAATITNDTQATSFWDNALYEVAFTGLWSNRIDARFLNSLTDQRFLISLDKVPTIYLSNHDHSHIAWQAGAAGNEGSMQWWKLQPYLIALYTAPATPMVPNGQEFGEDHWIPENDQGTGRRVSSRPLRWKLVNDDIGKALLKLHGCLGEIRAKYPGLRAANFYPQPWEEWQTQFNPAGYGVDTGRQLAIYQRWGDDGNGRQQHFVVVLNFSDRDQTVNVPFPEDGVWTDLLSGYQGSWKPTVTGGWLSYTVGSHWGNVFFK